MYAERAPELTYTFGDAETGFIVTPVSSEMKQALESAVVDGPVEGGGRPASTGAVATSVRPGTPAGAGSAGRAGPASSGGTGAAVVPTAPVYLTQTTDRSSAQRLDDDEVLAMFAKLRRYGSDGTRSPHRALLALTALGRFARSRTSISPFSEIQPQLTRLISVFGPPVPSGAVLPSAADTFTELGREGVWVLDAQVTADESTPLRADVSGRFAPEIEAALGRSSRLGARVARLLVDLNFPETLTGDVLAAAGLDPDPIRRSGDVARSVPTQRRPRAGWFTDVLDAWQGRCAFCGFDGHVGSVAVGLEAAHVRWFALDGPDHVDNGLALCSLHHKLFDSGVLGLDQDYCVNVSDSFSGRSTAALAVRDLQDVQLDPPNGATLPAAAYVEWHNREVFKGA
jgi:putative restriction endonuclease